MKRSQIGNPDSDEFIVLKTGKQDACIYVLMFGYRANRRERHRGSGFRLPGISVGRFHGVRRARAAVGLSCNAV
jgi:hypothetical protein